VLEAAEGWGTRDIARELDTTPTTVSLWRGRFARERLAGLEDRSRSGAPCIYDAQTDQRSRFFHVSHQSRTEAVDFTGWLTK
jgi:hypothetical protein